MGKLIQNVYRWLIYFKSILVGLYCTPNPIPVPVVRVRPEFRKIRPTNRY